MRTYTQITKEDLLYLRDLLPKYFYSGLSSEEMIIASQMIHYLAQLGIKASGRRLSRISWKNIKDLMHGTQDSLNKLSNLAPSISQQEERGDLSRNAKEEN